MFLPSISAGSHKPVRERLREFDWVGIGLWAICWVLFIVIFTFAGSQWSWSDGRTIACFVVFGDLLIVFVGQQAFSILTTPEDRTFPCDMLSSLTQVLFVIGMAATNAALFLVVYYLPIFFQFTHGDTAIDAAVRLLPFLCVGLGTNFICGYYLPQMKYYVPLYLWAGLFIIAGAAPLYTITADTPIAKIYGYTVLVALGVGPALQAGYTLSVVKLIKQHRYTRVPSAIALMNVGQIGSGGICLVVAGQIFQTFAFRNLSAAFAGTGYTASQLRSIVAGTQSELFQQLSAEQKTAAVGAITSAMSYVWLLVLIAGAVNVLVALRMKWERIF